MPVTCPYCQQEAELVGGDAIYPHRPDLAYKRFWRCEPCQAYVGCHGTSSRPLGRLADAQLRAAKQAAHVAFDPMWHSARPMRSRKRKEAYAWLADMLGINREQCHIGMFDVETCNRVVEVCKGQPCDN